jgi:hypothetical protein
MIENELRFHATPEKVAAARRAVLGLPLNLAGGHSDHLAAVTVPMLLVSGTRIQPTRAAPLPRPS